MSLKQEVYNSCYKILDDKIAAHQAALHDLTEGLGNDTKSSAGDKHETSRAMMQLEYEKINNQLQEVKMQKELLERMHSDAHSSTVIKGSLIKTNKGYLFLSVPLGRINIGNVSVMVLSPLSPLGVKLMGLKVNDSTSINNTSYVVEEIS